MAITTTQIDNLADFTPAQMLKALNKAIIDVAVAGQTYSINGRSFSRANLTELKKIRDDIKAEVEAASTSTGDTIVLADISGA